MRSLLAAALICAYGGTAAAQTATDTPSAYVFEYSTVPMIRNAALAELGMRVGERGADWLLDVCTGDLLTRRSTGGLFARAGQMVVDIVIAGTMDTVAHEYGHATRATEFGGRPVVTIRPPFAGFTRGRPPHVPLARERLAFYGGGFEGSSVLAARTGDRIHRDGVATPADLVLVVFETLRSEHYIWKTLSNDRLSSPERFFLGGPDGRPGDPTQYVFALAGLHLSNDLPSPDDPAIFADIQSTARSVRRASLINFVDFELFAAAAGLSRDFLVRGDRRIGARWLRLGPIGLTPRLAYFLTPNGPERQVRTRYKIGAQIGQAYARWSDPLTPAAGRLVGAGGDYQRGALRGITPKLAFDAWQNPDGTTSLRGEISASLTRGLGDRFVLSAGAGGKGRGYLQGYALASGPYAAIGAGVRF